MPSRQACPRRTAWTARGGRGSGTRGSDVAGGVSDHAERGGDDDVLASVAQLVPCTLSLLLLIIHLSLVADRYRAANWRAPRRPLAPDELRQRCVPRGTIR